MNAEALRQHENWKAARARLGAPVEPPVPVVREFPKLVVDNSKTVLRPRFVYNYPIGPKSPIIGGVSIARSIIAETAAEFGFTPAEIYSDRRKRSLIFARHVAMHRVHKAFPNWSMPFMGRIFNRDHTSVLSALGHLEAKPALLADVLKYLEGASGEA